MSGQKLFTTAFIFFSFAIGIGIAVATGRIHFEPKKIPSPSPTSFVNRERLQTGFPVYLTIPSIAIHAPMQYVTIEDDGNMTAPNGPESVGWFDRGARPGDTGTAVLAGHSGYAGDVQGVFDELDQIRVGEKIKISDDQGVTMTFIVRAIKTFHPDDDASEVFTSSDNKSHLNLITCDGDWDNILQTHTKRLVVFTERID